MGSFSPSPFFFLQNYKRQFFLSPPPSAEEGVSRRTLLPFSSRFPPDLRVRLFLPYFPLFPLLSSSPRITKTKSALFSPPRDRRERTPPVPPFFLLFPPPFFPAPLLQNERSHSFSLPLTHRSEDAEVRSRLPSSALDFKIILVKRFGALFLLLPPSCCLVSRHPLFFLPPLDPSGRRGREQILSPPPLRVLPNDHPPPLPFFPFPVYPAIV